MSASLFPSACSPLTRDGSAGCRRQQRGEGSLGNTALAWATPCLGYQPVLSASPWVPVPTVGRLPLCPQQWLAGWGGLPPAHLYVCGWEGGDPAPNYIKNISMLWLLLLWCLDFACHLLLGKSSAEGVESKPLAHWLQGGQQKTVSPAHPASPAQPGAARGA